MPFSNDLRVDIPGFALLELASDAVDALNRKIIAKENEKIAAGEQDAAHELYEQRVDLSVTQSCIDPYRWAMDKAEHGRQIQSHEESPDMQARLAQLLDLGSIPKSAVVMPQAIALRRETRQLSKDDAEAEDVLLDFLQFLASHRRSKDFFRVVSDK